MSQLSTKVFLRLEPIYGYSQKVNGFRVAGTTTKKPVGHEGAPVIAVTITMPSEVFDPFNVAVAIEVPTEAVEYMPTVTVESPTPNYVGGTGDEGHTVNGR